MDRVYVIIDKEEYLCLEKLNTAEHHQDKEVLDIIYERDIDNYYMENTDV